MSQDKIQQTPDWEKLEEESDGPTIREVAKKTIINWPWLLLSIIVFLGIGVLIILRSPKTFVENAQVVIKNDSEGSSTAITNSFADLGIFSNNANVMNEIATMSSPDVMNEVVKMLNLNIEYFTPGIFHDKTLYGDNLPIIAEFPDLGEENRISFHVSFDPANGLELNQLKRFDSEDDKWEKSQKNYKGKIGHPIKTEFGTIIINPSENFSLSEDFEIIVNKNGFTSTVNRYTNKIKVNLADDDSTVVDISLTDSSRQRADEILAAIIAVYNDNWIKDKNEISESTSQFIDNRLGVIENELGNVDSDISEYKSANLVPDVNAVANGYLDESQRLSGQLLDIGSQLQAARTLKNSLSTSGNNYRILPASSTINNIALQAQIKDYNDLLLSRNNLESKSSDKNPTVQMLNEQLTDLNQAIMGSVDNVILSLESQIRSIQSAQGQNTSKLASNPTQAKYLLSVERQQKVKENLYLFLLQKREDNALNQAFTAYNTRIIKKPGGDGKPISPKSGMILAICFIFGVLVPATYNYFSLKWDTKVRGRKDLDGVKTPMLGEIPLSPRRKKSAEKGAVPKVLVKEGSRDIINESFRVLRTNVEFTRIQKDGCNVIALTSFNPGSGKSFISMNLGESLSLKGKRVLVVDGDMRRGTSSSYVNNPSKGLTDYLAGYEPDVEKLIVTYPDNELLNVLPIGHEPPNPTELLEAGRFEVMIEQLKDKYDYILVDCPPIELVADANIIDKSADKTIFVIRAGIFEKSLLKELDRFYTRKKYKSISFILNGVALEDAAYGNYGIYGRYGHYGRYGYYSKNGYYGKR